MAEFWNTLTTLIQQYTIADTANVFAIVEGIATVVAAVGAIIAVVVTIKISKKQNNLATKQNEISDKQADIAERQNKITLFNERNEIFENLYSFLNVWQGASILLLNVKDKSSLTQKWVQANQMFSTGIPNEQRPELLNENTENLVQLQIDWYRRDIFIFGKLKRLFNLCEEQTQYINGVAEKYNLLALAVFATQKSTEANMSPVYLYAFQFSNAINAGRAEFLMSLEDQVQVRDY